MSRFRQTDDILNINVGGKKFTVRRTSLLADPQSNLAVWFRNGNNNSLVTDKSGVVYLDRDSQTFRHILAYLRLKKEGVSSSLALPSEPHELARLIGECEALKLTEFKEMALEMLQNYSRTEEQNFVTVYSKKTLHDFEFWCFEQEKASTKSKSNERKASINKALEENDSENFLWRS